MTPGIAIYSIATAVSQEDCRKACDALAVQDAQHVAPAWARLTVVPTFFASASAIPDGMPTIQIADVCDDPDALAYHTEQSGGRITGLVGAKTCLDANESPWGALSHEYVETRLDPFCDSWVDNGRGILICLEACDPVQDKSYKIAGIEMSDFVLPAWFDDQAAPGEKRSYLGSVTGSFERTPGGYFVQRKGGGETQSMGMRAPHRSAFGRGAKRLAQAAA